MAVRALLFDIDQTLIDFSKTLENALTSTATYMRETYNIETDPLELQRTRDKVYQGRKDSQSSMLVIRRASFERVLQRHGITATHADDVLNAFCAIRFGKPHLMPDVISMLEQIPHHISIAAVTNGNSHPDQIGLGEFFDVVVKSEDFPFTKPDPRIFEAALRLLSIEEPSSTYHVGDSIKNDVAGAKAAGINSIWYNPKGEDSPLEIKPDYEIRGLLEIPALISELSVH
ncbi:MAG: HAD family hydrolase [Pseudomonadota bacterium]